MCGADGYESVEGLSYEDVHSVLRKRLEKEKAKSHESGSKPSGKETRVDRGIDRTREGAYELGT